MPCYHPLSAYQRTDGEIVFAERGDIQRNVTLACGQCIGCRLERSRQWAVRCMHEAKMHRHNCFLTVTYADEHLPQRYFTGHYHPRTGQPIYSGNLDVRHTQLFLKRLRKALCKGRMTDQQRQQYTATHTADMGLRPIPPLRFYLGAEYGEQYGRPHYHLCLFGYDPHDKLYSGKSPAGHKMYTSQIIADAWKLGLHQLGELTFDSAAYTARYIMKKITGKQQKQKYEKICQETGEIINLKPEFNTMSRKPGIANQWFEKYNTDVYPRGKVIIRGHTANPPRYYDKQYEKRDPLGHEMLQWTKYLEGRQHIADQTPERLSVREQVARASLSQRPRKI